MRVKDVSRMLEGLRDTTESVIGNVPLWADFKRDDPQISEMLHEEGLEDSVIDVILPLTTAYVAGWMRAQNKIRG